jgi:hypothetical protein
MPGLIILGCFFILFVVQSCFYSNTPEGMVFSTQGQIDSFLIIHRDCTVIQNGVTIAGEDITNLDGLNAVTAINGFLSISKNTSLTSLGGLSNLTSISKYFDMLGNPRLRNLEGLNKLHYIGNTFFITSNDNLTSLQGLDSLKVLNSLHVNFNNELASFKGLENLTEITSNLMVTNNPLLTNFEGLQNLERIGGSLFIKGNIKLSDCSIQAVCSKLGVSGRKGVSIDGNASGCNSAEEVIQNCKNQ